MKTFGKMAIAAAMIAGASMAVTAPAEARVAVRIGVGVPSPAYYYGPGYYPPGPCDAYTNYYDGDCGYSVYNGPVAFDGVTVGGPHYYRWYGGQPYFWYRGGWRNWNGWRGVRGYGWNHGEGYGWRGGRWNRG
ncbi:MAG TPA: hypothetical protein VH000_10015, partial [Rhizomicrobium sp.]|nr:hypothetical protein [Rhizomicrobium sp.]